MGFRVRDCIQKCPTWIDASLYQYWFMSASSLLAFCDRNGASKLGRLASSVFFFDKAAMRKMRDMLRYSIHYFLFIIKIAPRRNVLKAAAAPRAPARTRFKNVGGGNRDGGTASEQLFSIQTKALSGLVRHPISRFIEKCFFYTRERLYL